jgi:hypothetical protein
MGDYHFMTRNSGTAREKLGDVDLANDAAALRFGRQVVRELMQDNLRQPPGWFMVITQDKRAVGKIRLVAEAGRSGA